MWLRHLDRRRQAALEAMRREERLELARELHDVVAHHVTVPIEELFPGAETGS
jgi:signal transduction histidine kinase